MARARALMAFSWQMTRLCSSSSTRSSFCVSSSLMLVMGTPVQRLTTSSMSSRADDAGGGVVEVVLVAQGAQAFALLALLVGVEAGLLEFVIGDGRIHAVHDELDALLDFGDLLGQRGLAQLDARAGLVDQVDGLVGQEAVGDVAVGVGDGELDGGVGVADGVEFLVAVLDAVDDLDGVGLVGRRHLDGLEAALQGAVLLDGFAVLGRGGGADALDFSAARAPA